MNPQPVGRPILVLALCALVGGGCVIMNDQRALALQAATSRYESAIRWGYFETAYGFVDPALRKGKDLPALYKDLRLTGYEVVQQPMEADKGKATQIVTIDYLHEDRQSMMTLTDRQVWQYDKDLKNWWLVSGLPAFK